ncbi:hypothetical protein ACJX0J_036715, partial [Zea mays]
MKQKGLTNQDNMNANEKNDSVMDKGSEARHVLQLPVDIFHGMDKARKGKPIFGQNAFITIRLHFFIYILQVIDSSLMNTKSPVVSIVNLNPFKLKNNFVSISYQDA